MARLATGDYLIENEVLMETDQSVRMLRFMADQVHGRQEHVFRRFNRKPKRLASSRTFSEFSLSSLLGAASV